MTGEELRSPLTDEESAFLFTQEPAVRAMWMAVMDIWAVAVRLHEAQHVLTGVPIRVRVKPWAELSMKHRLLVYESLRTYVLPPLSSIAIQASAL